MKYDTYKKLPSILRLNNMEVNVNNGTLSISADTYNSGNISSVKLQNISVNNARLEIHLFQVPAIGKGTIGRGDATFSFPFNRENIQLRYVKEMTKEEIEKELGYKISII